MINIDFESDSRPFEDVGGHRIVYSMGELRRLIDEGLEIRKSDIPRGSAQLTSLIFKPPASFMEYCAALDPYSDIYASLQMQLYEAVAGKAYSPGDEGHEYDISEEGPPASPFPFHMDPRDAGYWTVIYGHILQALDLPRGGSVLEIGYGPAGLTELLVRAGLDVTGVELRESNARFARRRAQALGLNLKTVTGDISQVHFDGKYDRIIFFESFHHIPHFYRTLERLIGYLAPRGSVYFAAEPIVADDDPVIPFPWGVRLDGGALSAGRDVGWLEIGFQKTFIYNMLAKLHLNMSEQSLPHYHHSHILIGRRD